MGENVIERLVRIETQLASVSDGYTDIKRKIDQMSTDLTEALQSTKSAHHRIDEFKRDVCWTIGVSTTSVGIFASILTWALGR
ncbi:hypothetical protein FYJ78_03340 [Selenomonas sp. WCA-380-WT-3B 3/]|uniref:Hemolysin XhlA n=1 Tax=Selenomonas montiformis TaxID=2652285 RepID=A0A6I2UV53_9FIRM|nr:hypothetical protein [Selenomonas montiformis]MSV24235.1 hypothetical protein [Selenomonas montiformis]